MTQPTTTFAICTRNRARLLRECVESLVTSCAGLRTPWEILVIDNGSTDETQEVLQGLSSDPHLRTVREERMGISHARNAAVHNAPGRILVYIDDDVLVPPEYAERIYTNFEARNVDILGGPMLPRWEGRPPFWLSRDLYGVLGLIEGVQIVQGRGYPRIFSGNMACRRELLASLGPSPFDPRLGRSGTRLIGNEESYLIDRLSQMGAKIGFAEDAPVYHRVPADRLTLRHFLRYYFYAGVSDCREACIRSGNRVLPRWVIGELVRRGAEVPLYLVTGQPAKAVVSLFRFTGRLGRIYEYVRTGFHRVESAN
ncbi:MAG: glycosyltransferase family 2 protein [Planctomycetes bacterium]|nr:glycosyltransferase family 2 protein [Planctomycetota bacterium]